MNEVFLLLFLLAACFAIFARNGRDDAEEAILEAEEESDRRRRLDILRTADGKLDYDNPQLLLRMAYATMAVAYEETSWEERLSLARQARRAVARAKNVYARRRYLTPRIRDALYDLEAVCEAAKKCEAECRLLTK